MKLRFYILLLMVVLIPSSVSAKVTYNMHVTGNSMYPAIESGDIVKVQTATASEVKEGDIVCYNYDKRDYLCNNVRYVCHRVIEKLEDHVCTKGDNNQFSDNCVENKYIALRVIT